MPSCASLGAFMRLSCACVRVVYLHCVPCACSVQCASPALAYPALLGVLTATYRASNVLWCQPEGQHARYVVIRERFEIHRVLLALRTAIHATHAYLREPDPVRGYCDGLARHDSADSLSVPWGEFLRMVIAHAGL